MESSTSPQAVRVSISFSFLCKGTEPHTLAGDVVVIPSCQLCRWGPRGCYCRQGWCVSGVQASDGCLMGLGAHTVHTWVTDLPPGAEAQSWLPSSHYQEKAASACQLHCDTGLGIGRHLNELEQNEGLCCGSNATLCKDHTSPAISFSSLLQSTTDGCSITSQLL